jgi:antitoxin component of MazEF toxin-antitoxin module
MRTTLIKVGNSQGIRLPKAIIEQAGLGKDLDLIVKDGAVIIRDPSGEFAKAGLRQQPSVDPSMMTSWKLGMPHQVISTEIGIETFRSLVGESRSDDR